MSLILERHLLFLLGFRVGIYPIKIVEKGSYHTAKNCRKEVPIFPRLRHRHQLGQQQQQLPVIWRPYDKLRPTRDPLEARAPGSSISCRDAAVLWF
jgi:hypothetical protein